LSNYTIAPHTYHAIGLPGDILNVLNINPDLSKRKKEEDEEGNNKKIVLSCTG